MKKLVFLLLFLSGTMVIGQATPFDHNIFNQLLQKHVSAEGNVNYKGFASDKQELEKYLAKLSDAKEISTWTKNEQLAFYINAYNAFTIQLILNNYPLKSIMDLKTPWDQKFFSLEGKKMSLNEIEHEILRKQFNEPRIHFAIVCASYSCPPLLNEAYSERKLDYQLNNQAVKFINDPKRNIISQEKPQLSEIFSWFKDDFTKKGTLIQFINQYSTIKINEKAKVSYLKYKWNLNE